MLSIEFLVILVMMSEIINEKVEKVKEIFKNLSAEERYRALISLGRKMEIFDPAFKSTENLVSGCQSLLYLHATHKNGKIHFSAYSEALISAGLAQLLIEVYSGESPETILTFPPEFLKSLNFSDMLTPNRSSGLYQIHLKMKQLALKALVQRSEI